MGNSIIPNDSNNKSLADKLEKESLDKEYIPISEKKETIIGNPKIVRSNISGLQLEEYIVNNNDSPIEYDIHLYKLRSSSYSKSIAVVYHHKLIDESMKIFIVRTEKMKGRLNQIEGLTFMEGLVLLEAAFGGFSELVSHSKSPFIITQRMISINSSNMVRVWLNQNYAMNKVMQPGMIQNENQMIHQAFTLVQDRVHPEQRHPFSQIRYRIGQCIRLIDAKHMIANILLNTNRKFILQDLVEKQTRKANTLVTNFKIPMNNYQVHQPQPHILNSLSPFNHQVISPEHEKARITPEQFIRDDEGSDRIRLIRQEMKSPPGHLFIGSPLPQNPIFSNNRRQIEPKSNDQRDQRPHSSMMVSPTPKNIYLKQQDASIRKSNVFLMSANQSQSNPNLRLDSNEKNMTQTQRSPRPRTIFGSQGAVAQDYYRSPRGISPIKNVSPFKLKQDQNSSAYNLTSKIALSQNKLSQMQKKINKLKSEFTKNNKQKSKEKSREIHPRKPSQKKEEPIFSNTFNISNSQNNEALPTNKYTFNRLTGEGGKWDNKKSQFFESSSTKPNNSQAQGSEATNQRKSQIFNGGRNNQFLRKSGLSQNPVYKTEFKIGTNSNFQFRSQNNFPSDSNTKSNIQQPTYSRVDQNQMSKTSISNFGDDTKSAGERYYLGPQQSQFRLISSPFILNMDNGLRTVTENKSSILGRRNNF